MIMRQSSVELNQDRRHVITAVLGHLGTETVVEEVGQDRLLAGPLALAQLTDQFDHALAIIDKPLPDAITAHQNIILFARKCKFQHVGQGGHLLLLGGQVRPLFVLEVAYRPAEVESPVDAAHGDHPSSINDAGQLFRLLWFVVVG
jgi:hypothetical protein